MLHVKFMSISKGAAVCQPMRKELKHVQTLCCNCPHLFQYIFHLWMFLQVQQINVCNLECPAQQRHPPPNRFHLHNYRACLAQERERSNAFT